MEKLGAAKAQVIEGRTQKVNAAIARMMMNPDPAEAVRTQGLVATAQQRGCGHPGGQGWLIQRRCSWRSSRLFICYATAARPG